MNQRIRDLQIQAFAECKTFEDGNIRTDEVFEKFAQLIVRECAALADQAEPYKANDLILKHFGVEE